MSLRRRFAFVIAALLALPLAVVLIIVAAATLAAMAGVSIDASRWRDAVARRAAAALGRPVIAAWRGGADAGPRAGLAHRRCADPQPAWFHRAAVHDRRRAACPFRSVRRAAWPVAAAQLRGQRYRCCGWNMPPTDAATGRRRRSVIQAPRGPGSTSVGSQLQRPGIHYHDARSATRRVCRSGRAVRQRRTQRAAAPGGAWPGRLQHAYALRVEGGPLRQLQDDVRALAFHARLPDTRCAAARRRQRSMRVKARRASTSPPMPTIWRAIGRLVGAKLPRVGSAQRCTAPSTRRRTPCASPSCMAGWAGPRCRGKSRLLSTARGRASAAR